MVQKRFFESLICCFIFLVCLLTTACSNNDKSSNETTRSGSAIKGVISDGIVSAYKIVGQDKIQLTEGRTNQFGQFNLNIPEDSTSSLILLELSTDDKTRMRCDLTLGCVDQNTGELISFGKNISLPSYFKLLGIAGSSAQTSQIASITPLTHLMITTAKGLDGQITNESINIASDWVRNALGLNISPSLIELKDITSLANLTVMTDEQLKQSIISAAMYSETINSDWAEGRDSIDSIDIRDILSRASSLSKDLSSIIRETQDNDSQSNALNRVQTQLDSKIDDFTSSDIVILTQPSSVSLTENQGFSLYVQATSDWGISYQWYKNDDEIPGANSAVYSVSDSVLSDAGIYKVLISHDFSEITSLSASVNITKLSKQLEITQQPQNLSISEGDPIFLSVEVTNDSSLSYQWQKNGSIIPGASSNIFTIANSSLSDEGNYRVTISNNEKQISSNFVNVWVSESIEAVSITSHPQSKTIPEGASATFNVQATGDGFLRYQWRKNGLPITNQYSTSLAISSTTELDEGSYDVIVTNSQGSVISNAANLTVLSNEPPVVISRQPQSQSVMLEHSLTLNVSASGGESLNYQWFFNGDAIENAASPSLFIASASLDNQGSYSVLVNNEGSSQQSEVAFVTVNLPESASLPALRSLVLSWDTPTEREDGSSLSYDEIMAYVIEYGYNKNALENRTTVEKQLPNSLVLNELSAGELFLRIATIDSDKHQGEFSDTISVLLY